MTPGRQGRELAACGALVRHAYQASANQNSNFLTKLLLVLALLVPPVAGLLSGQWARAVGFGAGVPLAMVVLIWWTYLAISVADQNRHAARLVPGIGRRSIAVLVAAWALALLVLTPLFGLAGLAPLEVAEGIGFLLVIVAAAMNTPAVVWPISLYWAARLFIGKRLDAFLASVFTEHVMVAIAPLAIAGLGYFMLRKIARGLPQSAGAGALVKRTDGARLVSPASASYVRMLLRDCARGRPRTLLMHAIGESVRAPALKSFAIVLGIALIGGFAASGWIDTYRGLLRVAVPAAIVAFQVIIVPTMLQAVYATRPEQALVRLAPRVPQAAALNAALARALLLEYGQWWLRLTLLALLIAFLLDAKPGVPPRLFAAALLMLAPALLLLRDYTVARSSRASVRWGMIAAIFAVFFVALLGAGGLAGAGLWLLLDASVLAGVLVAGRMRWDAMLRAPAAFPVARAA
jgi:hypothetical protein